MISPIFSHEKTYVQNILCLSARGEDISRCCLKMGQKKNRSLEESGIVKTMRQKEHMKKPGWWFQPTPFNHG